MFERFTDRARRVVVLAQEEARMLYHDYIGTEHILLGLIHEGQGVAAKTLESLGISLQAVRQQVEEIIGRGERPPSGYIEFTPGVKTVLELTRGEAQQLGHGYIGTEHILLGLIGEGEGVAAQVLVTLGADEQRVCQQVIQVLHDSQGKDAARGGGPSGPASQENRRPVNEHENRRLIDELVQRVSTLESRLAAILRHPDPDRFGDRGGQPRRDRRCQGARHERVLKLTGEQPPVLARDSPCRLVQGGSRSRLPRARETPDSS